MRRPDESPEDKYDRLKKLLQDSILRDYPNPARKGCPGGAVLRELAERPFEQPIDDDPHWHHVTHCSECYREFLGFIEAFRGRVRRTRVVWGVAVAAVVLVAAVLAGLRPGFWFSKRPQNAELAWVDDTIVVPSETRSGNAGEQKPIFLRRLPLRLTVQLPIGSKAGTYELQLKMDDRTVLSTGGIAEIRNGITAFVARADVSKLDRGSYSMIIRQVPNDWNLYPVVLQ